MNLENIKIELKKSLDNVSNENELNEIKAEYLGKKGYITNFYSKMKELNNEEKKSFGAKINNLKLEITSLLDDKKRK